MPHPGSKRTMSKAQHIAWLEKQNAGLLKGNEALLARLEAAETREQNWKNLYTHELERRTRCEQAAITAAKMLQAAGISKGIISATTGIDLAD